MNLDQRLRLTGDNNERFTSMAANNDERPTIGFIRRDKRTCRVSTPCQIVDVPFSFPHVFYLPKYSPDWNRDEKVWNHLKHHELKGHQAKTKAELTLLTRRKLGGMAENRSLLRGLFFRCCVATLFE